jgi:hypothetical protein
VPSKSHGMSCILLLCAAEMQRTAPDKEILELFSLARSRLDAPLLSSFVHSSSQQPQAQQAPAAAMPAAAAAEAPVEVIRMVASIARPSTGRIHQMAKAVLQERNDTRLDTVGSCQSQQVCWTACTVQALVGHVCTVLLATENQGGVCVWLAGTTSCWFK